MNYTREQRNFIDDRGNNILVSAAAGSGKTAVIVERVLRLIMDEGYKVSELLVVTFTRAAAAEMRDRIRDALMEKLTSLDITPDQREHLEEQMSLIYTADITTIDSFCLNVVRSFFCITGADPSFRVADEGELKLISEDVMSALLEDRYAEGDKGFMDLVSEFSTGRSDSDIVDVIRQLYAFAISRPDPGQYLENMAAEYEKAAEGKFEDTLFMEELLRLYRNRLDLALGYLKAALRLCTLEGGPEAYEDNISDDMDKIEALRTKTDYDSIRDALHTLEFTRLKTIRKTDPVDPSLRDRAKSYRDKSKEIIGKELRERFFEKQSSDIIFEMEGCLPHVSMLSGLAGEYMERYAAAKEDKGVVDFQDLEHMALRILSDEDTRLGLRDRYKEIIIDEYQDSNRIQEEIFSLIGNGHDYVAVGDIKQSIYSFRDACPRLFADKAKKYGDHEIPDSKLMLLSSNFRSSRAVTDSVNLIFENIMTEGTGGCDYDETQRLNYGGLYSHESDMWQTEYLRISKDDTGQKEDLVREAEVIAERIHELVGVCDIEDRKTHEVHKCRYSDIVILYRSLTGVGDAYSEVFGACDIPVIFDSKSGYLLSYEIREILNLLTVMDNPRQDIPLAGTMLGFFGGFNASDMAYIRSYDPQGDLYDSLLKACDDTSMQQLSDRCRKFSEKLDAYRSKSLYTSIHELIGEIITDHGYDHYVRAMEDGERRLNNLRLLKKRALDYESTSFHGLFRFLRYIDNMRKYDVDFGEASGSDASDSVRIMSIHHSKGLEFPVVMVCGLGKMMNFTDTRAKVLTDDDLGAGCDLALRDRSIRIRTLIKAVIAEKKKRALVSEEMRVLYVALSRAENKLIMSGVRPGGDKVKADPSDAVSLMEFVDCALERVPDQTLIEIKEINDAAVDESMADKEAGAAGEAVSPINRVMKLMDSVDDKEVAELIEGMDYRYPYESALKVPQKVSVSYIKHEAMEEKGVSIVPDVRDDTGIPSSGALRGSAVHTAFENLDLGMTGDSDHITGFIKLLVDKKKLSEESAAFIRESDIQDFLASDIARRMHEAALGDRLYREQPFVISVKASDIDRGYPDSERVMVQGIIDAFFMEDDKVVVVDYKTDSVSDEQILIDRYQAQLDYYERALKQLLGVAKSEKVIYSVHLSKEIQLP